MKIDYQDRIDDYLLDRMSDEERIRFETDAADDAELKEQLTFTETVQQTIKSRNEKLALMKEWENDYKWKHPSERRIMYWVYSIAAVLIAGFFFMQNFHQGNGDIDYMLSLEVDKPSYKGGSDNYDINLLLGQKKYKEALVLIKQKSLSLEADSLGIAHDMTKEEKAKEYDMLVVKEKRDDLKWLQVHALLGLNQRSDALMLLDELRLTEGRYKMVADSLYNHIKK